MKLLAGNSNLPLAKSISDYLEIELTESKGTALFSMLGYSHPLVESTFARALTLCEQLGSPPSLRVLHGVWAHHVTRSNRDAIGAWIKVQVEGHTLWRQVMPTRGYLSQSELPVTIGLGNASKPDSVEIAWPSGEHQMLNDVAANRLTTVVEPGAK